MENPVRPIKIGIVLPDSECTMDGRTAGWHDLMAMATLAEDLGFDSVWNQDHLLFRGDWNESPRSEAPWECWSILSAIAAVTSRIEIGPLVSCTSFRNPALLAKIATTVDEISGGRLILGLGAGWHEPEYDAFGYPFDHRVSRFEEALAIIHGLLRTGHVDFHGQHYTAADCELRPVGPRPGGIPIMIGSTSPRMLGLLAKYADLWNAYHSDRINDPSHLPEVNALVDNACIAAGRDPRQIGRTLGVIIDLDGTGGGRNSVNTSGAPPLRGTPEELARALVRFHAAGIVHLMAMLEPMTAEGIERFAPIVAIAERMWAEGEPA